MRLVFVPLLVFAVPANAEVVSASAGGFEIRQQVNLVAPPATAFAALGAVSQWWDGEHTYSGKAQNLTLSLQPGACFCERFPDGGGIEHLRVAYVDPGKRLVLSGALGPLLYEGTSGVMDIEVKPKGGGSQLTMTYRVAGFARGGAEKMAPLVDGVLANEFKRYRDFVTRRPRT